MTATLDTLLSRYRDSEITRGELFVGLLANADDGAFGRVVASLPDTDRCALVMWARAAAAGATIATGQGLVIVPDAARTAAAAAWLRSEPDQCRGAGLRNDGECYWKDCPNDGNRGNGPNGCPLAAPDDEDA